MVVNRIVANVATDDVARARAFYGDLLGLNIVMDQGWIMTFAAETTMAPQISFASQGGSGTAMPDPSIDVDDVDNVHAKAIEAGLAIEYGPADEPWGVRRFYPRDPFGKLINILGHI